MRCPTVMADRFRSRRSCKFESLDQRILLTASVAARHVFYNDSYFDGTNPNANSDDDGAIAPDKQVLLPGQTATSANFSDTILGINGIMIDIAGLPHNGPTYDLSANDFTFKIGNTSDPTTWDVLEQTPDVSIRPGEGKDGSDRVTLIWQDASILFTWLQVTVKANNETGLSTPDVFYFGNMAGDVDGSFSVENGADYLEWQNAFQFPTTQYITSTVDFDHNGSVDNGIDYLTWQYGFSSGGTLITLAAPDASNSSSNSHPPEIIDFTFVEDGNVWSFSGEVVDDDVVTDLTVSFGGLLVGYSTTVDSDGTFALLIPGVQGATGSVTSVTVDRAGLGSNVAMVFV